MGEGYDRWFLCLIMIVVWAVAVPAYAALNSTNRPGESMLQQFWPSAKKGDRRAQYNMGVIYDQGLGVQQNYKQARRWYKKSAAQGFAKAAYNLGVLYQKGHGVDADLQTASFWYLRAARLGSGAAQNNLAVMYANGQGIGPDLYLAAMWAARSVRSGYHSGQHNLQTITENMPQETIQRGKAQLYSNPSASSVVLQDVDAGASVVILKKQDQWSHVLLSKTSMDGWVDNQHLSGASDTSAEKTQQPEPAHKSASLDQAPAHVLDGSNVTKVAAGDGINVRRQPALDATVIQRLYKGESVTVVATKNDWSRVKLFNGVRGWVASYLLTDPPPSSQGHEKLEQNSGAKTPELQEYHSQTVQDMTQNLGWPKDQIDSLF